MPEVLVKDISSVDLITYHPDYDLLPLILENCEYTFECGKTTTVTFNQESIQQQLIDRFLFTKSRIVLESVSVFQLV